MSGSMTLTNKQTVSGGVTILDEDKQPFTELPEGVKLTFVSSNPEVAAVTVREDGMNIDVATGKNGTAILTVHVDGITKKDGSAIPDDVTNIIVKNSQPDSLNFTFGAPADEQA